VCAGHYADAGEVAVLMSSSLDVHMVMTGHSLGRNKLEHLLASGERLGGFSAATCYSLLVVWCAGGAPGSSCAAEVWVR
jgi:hypothetical protein